MLDATAFKLSINRAAGRAGIARRARVFPPPPPSALPDEPVIADTADEDNVSGVVADAVGDVAMAETREGKERATSRDDTADNLREQGYAHQDALGGSGWIPRARGFEVSS